MNCITVPALVEEKSDGELGGLRAVNIVDRCGSDHPMVAGVPLTGVQQSFQVPHDRSKAAGNLIRRWAHAAFFLVLASSCPRIQAATIFVNFESLLDSTSLTTQIPGLTFAHATVG